MECSCPHLDHLHIAWCFINTLSLVGIALAELGHRDVSDLAHEYDAVHPHTSTRVTELDMHPHNCTPPGKDTYKHAMARDTFTRMTMTDTILVDVSLISIVNSQPASAHSIARAR